MSKCINCGADIGKDDVKCPYCSAMQYDAAEKQYMEKLYALEEDMDKLDDDAKVFVFRDTIKSVLITFAAAIAAVGMGISMGYVRYHQYYASSSEEKEIMEVMDRYEEIIDYVEDCYQKRDFASIKAKLEEGKSSISHKSLKNWEHYPLCIIYYDTYFNFERIHEDSSGRLTKYEFETKYRAAVNILGIKIIADSSPAKEYIRCTDYDKAIADGWISEAEDFMENEAGLTRQQYENDIKDIYEGSSYPEYTKTQEYADKYYKTYTDSLNGGV